MSTKASFPFSPYLPRPPIFSMVSKLTLCSPTWDCRIQQLMQPWIWLETLTTQSAVPMEMYGPCCTAQCDSSSITTCSQHCTLLYFVWKHRSSPFRQILVMLLVVVDGALRRKWAGADSFWVSCKTCRLPFGGEEKSFAERIRRFRVSCHTACCRAQQSEDLKPGYPTLVTGLRCMVRSLTIQKSL